MSLSGVLWTAVVVSQLAVTAVLTAASLRIRSFVSSVLAAYVVLVAVVTAITIALSPFRLVTRWGLEVAAAIALGAALLLWNRRGGRHFRCRPLSALRAAFLDPAVLVLLAAVVASSLYEFVLVLGAPPNNWDSLTYHLTRAAGWAQHGGVHWIGNAPTDRINEFQPLAEQQVLLLFVTSGRAALFALPQWLGGLVAIVGVFGVAARLGFAHRTAAFAALLFGTFPLVALSPRRRRTTWSRPLCRSRLQPSCSEARGSSSRSPGGAGARARRQADDGLRRADTHRACAPPRSEGRSPRRLGAAAASFVLLGMWGFVLNLVHTGSVLGRGERARSNNEASPSLTGSPTTAFRVLHDLLDLSGLGLPLTDLLAGLSVVVAGSRLRVRTSARCNVCRCRRSPPSRQLLLLRADD